MIPVSETTVVLAIELAVTVEVALVVAVMVVVIRRNRCHPRFKDVLSSLYKFSADPAARRAPWVKGFPNIENSKI